MQSGSQAKNALCEMCQTGRLLQQAMALLEAGSTAYLISRGKPNSVNRHRKHLPAIDKPVKTVYQATSCMVGAAGRNPDQIHTAGTAMDMRLNTRERQVACSGAEYSACCQKVSSLSLTLFALKSSSYGACIPSEQDGEIPREGASKGTQCRVQSNKLLACLHKDTKKLMQHVKNK